MEMSVKPRLCDNHSQLYKEEECFQQATGYTEERASEPLKILKMKRKRKNVTAA